jgi:hypothetical protein
MGALLCARLQIPDFAKSTMINPCNFLTGITLVGQDFNLPGSDE